MAEQIEVSPALTEAQIAEMANAGATVEDLINNGLGNKGQEHLPTGSQMEQAENALVAAREKGLLNIKDMKLPLQTKTPEQIAAEALANANKTPEQIAAEKAAAEAAKTTIPEGFDVDALVAKIENGEALTDEEAAIAQFIQKQNELNPPPPPPEEKKYKVADKEYTAAEFEAKMREEMKLGAVDLSKETIGKMMDVFHRGLNKTEFSTTTQQKSMENAATAKEQERIAAELAQKERELQVREQTHNSTKMSLEQQRQVYQIQLDTTYKDITPESIRDEMGNYDPIKSGDYAQKRFIEGQIRAIDAQLQGFDQSSREIAASRHQLEVDRFIAMAPQYRPTTGTPFQILERVINRDPSVDASDKLKVLELDRIFRESKVSGVPAADVYELWKAQRHLAVEAPMAQASGSNGQAQRPELPRILPKTVAQTLREWNARWKNAPPQAGGGGGTGMRGAAAQQSVARQLVTADTALLANGAQDPFMAENLKGY